MKTNLMKSFAELESVVLASKQLTELEVQKATKPLIEEIEQKLNCKFIGVTDEFSDEYNLGLILNKIIKIN